MITLNNVYALPRTLVKLTDWILRADWFPEVPDLEQALSSELLELLEKEGRFTVERVAEEHHDHRRYAQLHTLCFDGAPIALVQNAGREGDDHRRRLITDAHRFIELCHYLQTHAVDRERYARIYADTVDADTPMYEEEVSAFYGTDLLAEKGYPKVPRTEGFFILSATRLDLPLPAGLEGLGEIFLVGSAAPNPPEYIRRGAFVLRRLTIPVELTDEARNKLLDRGIPYTSYYFPEKGMRPESCISV